MTFTNFSILSFSILISLNVTAQAKNDSVFKGSVLHTFSLIKAVTNQKQKLKESSKQLQLFIFVSPECPLCKRYTPLLKNLHERFQQKVEFYGIVPGKAYSVDEVRQYRSENDIAFPVLIDEDKKLSNYLQAAVTPEVILLNSNFEMVYRGAIDNLLVKLGKQRPKATEDFLLKALSQSIANHKISVKRTKAVGCRINDY